MNREEFWVKCFFMFFENWDTISDALSLADDALKEFDKRFTPIEGKPDFL